jgi:excisionase family DNA binding protein
MPESISEKPSNVAHLMRGGKAKGQKNKPRPFGSPDKLAYSKDEVAYHLSLGVRKIDELINSGQLRASTISKRTVRILKTDLITFLEARANQ